METEIEITLENGDSISLEKVNNSYNIHTHSPGEWPGSVWLNHIELATLRNAIDRMLGG